MCLSDFLHVCKCSGRHKIHVGQKSLNNPLVEMEIKGLLATMGVLGMEQRSFAVAVHLNALQYLLKCFLKLCFLSLFEVGH